jgi:serine/threonine-protein kinase RsbW
MDWTVDARDRQATEGRPSPPSRPPSGRFKVEMSLQLPRDNQSVRLTRHLIMHSLAEIGVRQSDIDDVGLAVTEATANVISHAEGSDDYEVIFTVGVDVGEIRVIDTGHGFDHESLARVTADVTSDRGRGLGLMNALVDQARFASRPERGTVVHLVKNLHFESGPPDWLPGDEHSR